MTRVAVFVDGFNVYHALDDHRKYRKYKWLDYRKLANRYVIGDDSLTQVLLFTAYAYKGGEVMGLPVYRSLRDIPGPVDHVVSCVPAHETPHLIEDCRSVGAKVLQLYTAGFAETGEPDLVELQNRLVTTARQNHIRILGPNCMGIYCPSSKLSFCLNYYYLLE